MQQPTPPEAVLAAFGLAGPPGPQCVAITAGFSGNRVWHVVPPRGVGPVALRAWLPGTPLAKLHATAELLRFAAPSLPGVLPRPISAVQRPGSMPSYVVEQGDRQWTAETWLAGRPLELGRATDADITAACRLLGRWHRAVQGVGDDLARWFGAPSAVATFRTGEAVPVPAVERRVQQWRRLRPLLSRPLPSPGFDPRAHVLAERSRSLLVRLGDRIDAAFEESTVSRCPLRLCLRDVHREHVLFESGRVAGLIDFGALGLDSAACDLARYLGSVLRPTDPLWNVGLETYSSVAPLSACEAWLARQLAWTGTAVSVLRWYAWRVVEGRQGLATPTGDERWRGLLDQLDAWGACGA